FEVVLELAEASDRACEMEVGIVVSRDAQDAVARSGELKTLSFGHEAPFDIVGQAEEAIGHAPAAGSGEFVDARHGGATDKDIDARRACLEGGCGIVHGGGGSADDGDA